MYKIIVLISICISIACSKNEPKVNVPPIAIKEIPVVDNDTISVKAVSTYGKLSVIGNKIVDKNGNPVQLRGMSLFWSQWIGKFYNEDVVKWLKKDWQCNVIRAAMAIENDGYLVNKSVEKTKVYAVVDAAIKAGIYVIIDWHDHNAEKHLEEAKAFFSEVAQKYKNVPNIIYEPYNEPLNVSWSGILKPYHEAVIAEIRKHDPDNLVICGTRNWSQNVSYVINNKIDDANVAYTLHYYAATHKQNLRDIAKSALNAGVPLFVTEYGVTEASADGSIDANEANKWWTFLDENSISHCNWSIADKVELAAALKPNSSQYGNWSTSELTISGNMVRKEIRSKN